MLDQENLNNELHKRTKAIKLLLQKLKEEPARLITDYEDLQKPGFYADGFVVVENTTHEEAYRQQVLADEMEGRWDRTIPTDKGYQILYQFKNSTAAYMYLERLGYAVGTTHPFYNETLMFIEPKHESMVSYFSKP